MENDGKYVIGLKQIAPHKTVQIDVRKLRDEQTPDINGNTIPLNLNSGQIKWTIRSEEFLENQSLKKFELIGRSEQIDETNGISSSYACQNCCQKTAFGWVEPGNVTEAEVGDQIQFTAFEQGTDCYGNQYGPVPINPWSSNNNSVATVTSQGLVTIVGVGNVEIDGDWQTNVTSDQGGYCPGPFLTEQTNKSPASDENLLPDCNACYTTSRTLGDDIEISAVPKVIITPFEVVGKGSTFPIAVQVTGNTNNTQITLRLTKLSGTGESQFANNTSTTTITQSGTVELKGITESSAKDNYIIETLMNNRVQTRNTSKDRFSVAKVKILRTIGTGQPTEVTDLTADTIVGERIKLNTEILPTGITVSSHLWTLPGNVMKDFLVVPPTSTNPTASTSQVVPVDSLTTANVDYVWYDGADARIVNYKATVGGSQITGKTNFNVKRPEASVTTLTPSQTAIDSVTGVLEIHLGTEPRRDFGIRFSRSPFTTPSPFTGVTQWVQTIDSTVSVTTTMGQTGTDIRVGLDQCYPYAGNTGSPTDSPGIGLNGLRKINIDNKWKMYLMFKPSGDDSSWVSLREVNWRWRAEAEIINGNWILGPHTDPDNPQDSNTLDFPIWVRAIPSSGRPC